MHIGNANGNIITLDVDLKIVNLIYLIARSKSINLVEKLKHSELYILGGTTTPH